MEVLLASLLTYGVINAALVQQKCTAGRGNISAQIKNAPRIRQGAFSLIKLLLPVGAVRFYVPSVQIGDECQVFRLFFGERACIYSPRPVIAER